MGDADRKWIGYKINADGSKRRLTPGGKNVFGEKTRLWLIRRAKITRQKILIKKWAPAPPVHHEIAVPATHFSMHFTKDEFACHDGAGVPPHLQANAHRLAKALERLRHALGDKPMPLLSVYRTPRYNAEVHGARGSKHTTCEAADLNVTAIMRNTGKTHDEVLHAVESVPEFHGIGIYPSGAIHVDVRPGSRVFWSDWVRQ